MPSECVKVMVRVRPINSREKQQGCKECVDVDLRSNSIAIKKPNDATSEKAYSFDALFTHTVSQQSVYEASAFPLVENVFEGYNGTIFAYGQTGCGKTHTMMGEPGNIEDKGIIPRTFQHIINVVESEKEKKFLVRVSFLEIYNEEIHDLLSKDPKARFELKQSPEKGVFVKDLNQIVVKSVQEMEKLMHLGNENRSVGATLMNKDSSRSHSIFTIYIETSETDEQGNQRFRAGKLNLVDLAGSERQSKTQATGDRLKEANKINLSLSALGNVISALVDGKTHHIPYRDSKLTRLLEDSLGGNTKTIMIAAVSPADNSYDETSGTLRYASRAKNIKNAPRINEDPKDALLKEYADEINRLKLMLEGKEGLSTATQRLNEDSQMAEQQLQQIKAEMAEEKQRMKSEMENKEKKLIAERQMLDEVREKMRQLELNTMQAGVAAQGGVQSKEEEEQRKQYLELKKKLKKQQKLKEQLLEDKRRNEENLLRQGQEYQSMQEEVMELRESNKLLRKRLKQALEEVNDMLNEAGDDKEELLDAVRMLEKENALNRAIIDQVLTKSEYEQIRDVSTFDEDSKTYKVPSFSLKNKEIRFPKLTRNQAQDQQNHEKELRQLEFEKSKENVNDDSRFVDVSYNRSSNALHVNNGDSNIRCNSRGRSKQRKASMNNKYSNAPTAAAVAVAVASSAGGQMLVDKSHDFSSNSYEKLSRLPHNNVLTEVNRSMNPRRMIHGVVLEPVDTNATSYQQLIDKNLATSTSHANVTSMQHPPGGAEMRRMSKNPQLKPLHHSGKNIESYSKAIGNSNNNNNNRVDLSYY